MSKRTVVSCDFCSEALAYGEDWETISWPSICECSEYEAVEIKQRDICENCLEGLRSQQLMKSVCSFCQEEIGDAHFMNYGDMQWPGKTDAFWKSGKICLDCVKKINNKFIDKGI